MQTAEWIVIIIGIVLHGMNFACYRQGETWYHLRHYLTADLTSPQTMQNFVPELNTICDDFLELLHSCRRPDGSVCGFDCLTNRMGLECKYLYNKLIEMTT